jgi:hypothetical protein
MRRIIGLFLIGIGLGLFLAFWCDVAWHMLKHIGVL